MVCAIGRERITLDIEGTNAGDTAAPYAAGWHPYFRLGGSIDDLELRIPARTLVRTDEALIPIDGPDCRLDLDRLPDLDFRTPRRIAERVIDAFNRSESGPAIRLAPGGTRQFRCGVESLPPRAR